MSREYPYLFLPGVSEPEIIEEMLRNRDSEHWTKCYDFVTRKVHLRANNFSWSSQEEIVQEVMYKIYRYLPDFRFKCSFKSWLYYIIEHCIADEHRRLEHKERLHVPFVEIFTEGEHEGEELKGIATNSTEESFEKIEKWRNVVNAILEYANTSRDPVRNRQIIKMVLFEERTQTETAKVVGCDIGVVNYVVSEARRYVRKKMDHKP